MNARDRASQRVVIHTADERFDRDLANKVLAMRRETAGEARRLTGFALYRYRDDRLQDETSETDS